MNKEQYIQKKSYRPIKRNGKFIDRSLQDNEEHRFAGLKKHQFVCWAKSFPTEERYLILKVTCPKLVKQLFVLSGQQADFWKVEVDNKKLTTKSVRNFVNSIQNFIDGLVLISDQDYLDSIGFDFSFVGCPEKLYETLLNLNIGFNRLKNKQKNCNQQSFKFMNPERESWLYEAIKIIEQDYQIKMKNEQILSFLQRQRSEKKEFGNFWKNLQKSQKINFLLLGHQDIKNLVLRMLNKEIKIDPSQLEDQINQILNLQKKQICNKVFKCKLKKISIGICAYYQMIYKSWRNFANKSKIQGKTQGKKKNKTQNKRQKSLDVCSNQTNETDLKDSRLYLQEEDLYRHLQQDILQCSDAISNASNKFYERRVLAFERISAIFRMYGISCRLFGSCASGIAIKQSDIDIAINESILKYFQNEEDKKSQMGDAFQFMGSIFEKLPWVSKLKVIKTASIPIIKLTINTKIPVNDPYFTHQYCQILSRQIQQSGQVNADLTIQVTQSEQKPQKQSINHLGLISTNQINKWLNQIQILRPIIIMLKYQLSKNNLNETYLGGLNTYCLVVMIVCFIYSQKLQNEKNVAVVLMKFLHFYGWQFNQKLFGIDLRQSNSIFYQKNITQYNKFADLQVRDPLNKGKIMTRNCYQFQKIKQILRNIYNSCIVKKEQILKEQCLRIRKSIKILKNKQSSETQSGSQKQKIKVKNYFMEIIL